MTLHMIKDQLTRAEKPIVKVLHENESCLVSLVAFANGMMLREKIFEKPATLMVLSGKVKYFDVDKKIDLDQYDEFEIQADVTHYIIADACSLCLLTQDRANQDN